MNRKQTIVVRYYFAVRSEGEAEENRIGCRKYRPLRQGGGGRKEIIIRIVAWEYCLHRLDQSVT